MKESEKFIQVQVTCPTEELAREISRLLVVKDLAGCVQVSGPISSFYKWRGKLEEDQEWKCVVKTVSSRLDEIEEAIKLMHSYDVPEILVTDITGGSKDYLNWLAKESSGE
jgi:periplasmic divalent cation tolerance protein